MRKKVLNLILLWAALLALALIYTDRDEYTWRYEGGELKLNDTVSLTESGFDEPFIFTRR